MATEYSHFDKSNVCASLGFSIGKKGSEVSMIDSSGRLYQNGTSLVSDRAAGGSVTAGTYRFVSADFGCSSNGTIDTGLTTVVNAIWNIKGRTAAGSVNTLDLIATPDNSLGKNHYAAAATARYGTATTTGGNIWFKTYDASMDRATKRSIISFIAVGT